MRLMSRIILFPLLVFAVALLYVSSAAEEKSAKPDFDMTASYIEACSCDMFCPCYFNTHSTQHMDEQHMDAHFCRANLVLKVDKGHYKNTQLDGAKVWIATDLGSEWSTGKDSWAVVNFAPSLSADQKAALGDIIGQLYPFKWEKFDVDTQDFSWTVDEKTGIAHAKLNSGRGEVILERVKGDNAHHEVVMHNLTYWKAQSNDGFRMWKNTHEAFEGAGHKFAYEGTNGFLITIHFSGNAKTASAD